MKEDKWRKRNAKSRSKEDECTMRWCSSKREPQNSCPTDNTNNVWL